MWFRSAPTCSPAAPASDPPHRGVFDALGALFLTLFAGLFAALSLAAAWGMIAATPCAAQDPAAQRLLDEAARREASDPAAASEELELLVRQFPRDQLAPTALVELARLHLAQGNMDAADESIQRLLTDYARTVQAAEGFVLQGEMQVASALEPSDLENARITFRRVPLLFGLDAYPRLEARARARVRSADLGLILGDFDGAVAELVQAIEDEPPSPSTGAARRVLGRALLGTDDWRSGLDILQRLVDDVPPDPDDIDPATRTRGMSSTAEDRAAARRLLTLGHRHRVRPQAQQRRWTRVERVGTELSLDEPVGVAADGAGRVLIVDEKEEMASLFDPATRNWTRRPVKDPVRAGFTTNGIAFVVTEDAIVLPFDGQRVSFFEPVPGKERDLEKLGAAVRGRLGEWYVLAKGFDGVLHYPSPRKGNELLGGSRPEFVDLDRDELGRILVLDERDSKVLRLSLDRRSAETVARGDWKQPRAVARDALGQIYVLDEDLQQIFVFDATGQRIATLGPNLGGGIELRSPEDMAVDGAGRIYVADPKQSMVVVLD